MRFVESCYRENEATVLRCCAFPSLLHGEISNSLLCVCHKILNDVRGQVLRCTGTYYFYVELQSFNNPGNEDYDGGCCDVGCGSCDNYFILCLRQPGYNVYDDFCPYGSFSTSSDPDSGSALTFTTGPNALATHVPNPLEYAGNTWPVSVNRWLGLVYVFSKLYTCSFTEKRFANNC